ncbi:1-aminocyclopropane-1-carboxylate deaminase/D-cysteine desulfhydrase [Acinetobacter sp. HY1485]|uniref:1-aminocyclopropane-1-carboxylate deaminase/D-cysteine desulfhydrase n=1 Tax=Acinetobacter sp. HY1485 TaxID=2970918 RepID=UPI0022B94238|nr:pyridoxal-phosphate dependent enzyme [Acinetobacter sp. HY1485]
MQIQPLTAQLDIQRLDLVHPYISGNKFYKLKYNLIEAQAQQFKGVLTFGGAYSNHIAATAYAAHHYGLNSIGIIRGDELKDAPLNPTLANATRLGMQLIFVSRQTYKQRHEPNFLEQLQQQYPQYYLIPEGGTNALAIQGCKEILPYECNYDYICCAVGTGGTITGLIESTDAHIIGFSALKGIAFNLNTQKKNWHITDNYACGGYAKMTPELREFIQKFEQQYDVLLDPVYTAKMMYGIDDLFKKGYFQPNDRVLAIHTGGLQGRHSLI